jgi:hypothetical protein
MFSYCVETLQESDVKDEEVKLADWYVSATAVPNSREDSCFIPAGTNKIRNQCLSSSIKYTVVSISKYVLFKISAAETRSN